jgi:hypothetical protein
MKMISLGTEPQCFESVLVDESLKSFLVIRHENEAVSAIGCDWK